MSDQHDHDHDHDHEARAAASRRSGATTAGTAGATSCGNESMAGLWQRWRDWNARDVAEHAARACEARGDTAGAAVLRAAHSGPGPAAVDALAAQHELVSRLSGWQWQTVRAAREQGASWAQIATSAATTPAQARTGYLDAVHAQERAGTFADPAAADAAWAAAGRWIDELRTDVPTEALEQIERAVAAVHGDVDDPALDALRDRWWNPDHRPRTPAASGHPDTHDRDADDRGTEPRTGATGTADDAGGWFSDGYDAAHDSYLAAVGHTDMVDDEDGPGQVDGARDVARVDDVVYAAGLPPQMLDGIEQRRTEPAQRDDPANLQARLDDLRIRAAAAAGTPMDGWQTVGSEQAARDLTGRGVDLDTARDMVADYLRETSERIGAPAYEWGLDQGDLDAIAASHRLPTTLAPAATLATVERDTAEQTRDEQLRRWHTDEQAQAVVDDSAVDEAGWPQ